MITRNNIFCQGLSADTAATPLTDYQFNTTLPHSQFMVSNIVYPNRAVDHEKAAQKDGLFMEGHQGAAFGTFCRFLDASICESSSRTNPQLTPDGFS
jgi:hypothetical protein